MQYKQATWWEYPTNQRWYPRDYGTGYQYKPQDDQCLHLQCPSCNGTGVNKSTGEVCVHHLSCPCPRCTLR